MVGANAGRRNGGAPLIRIDRYCAAYEDGVNPLPVLLMADSDHRLDARGLCCPHPVLRARRALAGLECGQVLELLATDPASVDDIVRFARRSGHELLASEVRGEVYRFLLRKHAHG